MSRLPRPKPAVGMQDLLCALKDLQASVESSAPVVGIDAGEVVLGCAVDADGNQVGTVVATFEKTDEAGSASTPPVKWVFPFDGSAPIEGYTGAHQPCGSNTESDPVDWCVDGQEFSEWVLKRDGVPLGQSRWTNAQGIVVANPLTTANQYAKGTCAIASGGPIDIPLCTP